jgi:hypothetical protein
MTDLQNLFELRHGKDEKALSFLFSKIKRDYKTFEIPGEDELEEWLEACQGKSQNDLADIFKEYKACAPYNVPPTAKDFGLAGRTEKNEEKKAIYTCPEHEVIEALRASGIRIPYGEGNSILSKLVADFKAYCPAEVAGLKNCSEIVKAMRLNGWWTVEKFCSYVPARFLQG